MTAAGRLVRSHLLAVRGHQPNSTDDSSRDYVQKTGADGKVTWVEDKELLVANCQLLVW